MSVFDRYIFKNLLASTVITTMILVAILFLTQSLRFLELIVNAGASGSSFWLLTMLALPRFFEIILPIALMLSVLFVYSRLTAESELTVMRSAGRSPLSLGKAALILATMTTVFLWIMTSWAAPVSLSNMQKLRQIIKAEYSAFYLKEGVFNNIRPGLTIFLRQRDDKGNMEGLLIHDKRDDQAPYTIMARQGQIIADETGQTVIVFDGSRQTIDPKTSALNRLEFDRYTIDLPAESGSPRQRWMEPDERTLWHLLNPDPQSKRDMENEREFLVEAHRRIISPLLTLAYTLLGLAVLLLGPLSRRGQARRIAAAVAMVIVVQGLYLASFNMARQTVIGMYLMYGLVLLPIIAGGLALSATGEPLRRKLLFLLHRQTRGTEL